MASSGKIVVVKVLETYFGTAAVTKEFDSYITGKVWSSNVLSIVKVF